MPFKNNFQHQIYSADPPTTRFEVVRAEFPPQPSSTGYTKATLPFGEVVADNIDAAYLIHGTFAGNDALGWTAQLERIWPSAADQLKTIGKKIIDVLADDTGNFTAQYASQFQESLGSSNVAVRCFRWSGENNHSARSIAALHLLDELIRRQQVDDERKILLMCHSHAGNMLALVSNLLGADASQRNEFLELLRPVFRDSDRQAMLDRVSKSLDNKSLSNQLELNIVTLGTPIRYGWDTGGYRRLLHVVHHVCREDCDEFLSPIAEFRSSSLLKLNGDVVQQIGIAGTNFLPYVFDVRLMMAEQKLNRFLQPFGRDQFWDNLKIGARVPHEGDTLLVQYDDTGGLARKMAGHGVYTQSQWLPFHLQQVAKLFES